MPGLIEFVAQSAGMVEGGTLPDTRLAALNEVWKAFSLFFASVPEDLRELSSLRLGWPSIQYSASRCPVTVCTAANSDTGPGSELLSTIYSAHARYNAPAVVCDVSTSRIQGGYWDTPKHNEGHIGDVDKASSWGDGWGKANPGNETADISEVVLIVDLATVCTNIDGDTGRGTCMARALTRSGYHDDG
jgi:hypothetical protein